MEQLVALLELDTLDHNGVIFPTSVVEDAVVEFNKRVDANGGVLGELGHVHTDDSDRFLAIDVSRASHIVKHLWVDNAILKAKIQLLGKYAEIVEHLDIEVLGVPRSFGGFKDQICTSYTIVTVDIELPSESI